MELLILKSQNIKLTLGLWLWKVAFQSIKLIIVIISSSCSSKYKCTINHSIDQFVCRHLNQTKHCKDAAVKSTINCILMEASLRGAVNVCRCNLRHVVKSMIKSARLLMSSKLFGRWSIGVELKTSLTDGQLSSRLTTGMFYAVTRQKRQYL